jgi:hypothetical protein
MYAEIHSKNRGLPSSRLYQVMFDSVGYRTVVLDPHTTLRILYS